MKAWPALTVPPATLDTYQQELVKGARQSNTNAMALVTEILDVARLEEGRLILAYDTIDVRPLFESCVRELAPWLELEEKEVSIIAPTDLPTLWVDIILMQRVLFNLLSNAIKHTMTGTAITIGARLEDSVVVLYVQNNGLGIPAELQSNLFERFRIGNNRPARQANTGLGLTFCKLAVEAHGGTIDVQSGPERGTTFTVRLPLQPVTPDPAALNPHVDEDLPVIG